MQRYIFSLFEKITLCKQDYSFLHKKDVRFPFGHLFISILKKPSQKDNFRQSNSFNSQSNSFTALLVALSKGSTESDVPKPFCIQICGVKRPLENIRMVSSPRFFPLKYSSN